MSRRRSRPWLGTTTLIARVAPVILAALGAGCAAPTPTPFALQLRAETAPGVPLEGVRAWAGGRDLGTTDAQGRLHATVSGREGDRVSLAIACPADHHTDAPSRELPLRRIEAATTATRPIEVTVRCTPLQRRVALVVRADGVQSRSLPIEVQERKLGQTDADGVGHLLFDARPGATVRVKLVTAAYPKLEPRDPVQTFRVGDQDTILLFAQTFAEPRRAAPRKRLLPASLAPRETTRPYRIQ